jgi:hypothetical protein
MRRTVPLWCLVLGIGANLITGCSMSRNNLTRHEVDSDRLADEADGGTKTANADTSAADSDEPPSQPGVKMPGSNRKKLAGWLSKADPKRESIPLDRTDTTSSKDSGESDDDAGGLNWKQNDSSSASDQSQVAKSKKSNADETNLFDE